MRGRNLTDSEETELMHDNYDAAVAAVCPGCKIAFDASRPQDRQAKGFDECIDCVIADGREMDLDPQDLEDYQTRERDE